MVISKLELDNIIGKLLLNETDGKENFQLTQEEMKQLCDSSRKIFTSQPTLLKLEVPMCILGDIHGQYSDLLRYFKAGGFPPQRNYLFLGNYVDYGTQSLETICLLLAYKIKYPENFFLLRGNHECSSINHVHGFYEECKRRSNVSIWKRFIDCFCWLPVAALIGHKIFCVHGGLSPALRSLGQIRNIQRPSDVPDSGLLCDLLWADPDREKNGWGLNKRGVSYTFGADMVAEFLQKHDLDLICRSNQMAENGYEFFADKKLVTIFSAPGYYGAVTTQAIGVNISQDYGQYNNRGAMMNIDDSLTCQFKVLKVVTHVENQNRGSNSGNGLVDGKLSMDSAVGCENMLVLENDVMVPVDMQAENKKLPDYRLSEESRNAIYDSLQNHITAALLDLSNACQKMEFDKSQAEVLLKESEIEKAKLQTRVTELEIEKSKLEMEIEKSKLESRLTELGIEKSKLERHVKELETEKLLGETHIKELEARKQESSSVAVDSSIVQKLEQEVVSFREKVTSKDKELMGVRRQMAENREHYGDQCRETEKRAQIATLKAEENLRLAQLHEKDAEEKASKLAKCKNCMVRLHERVGGLNALLEKHNIEIPEDLGTSIEE